MSLPRSEQLLEQYNKLLEESEDQAAISAELHAICGAIVEALEEEIPADELRLSDEWWFVRTRQDVHAHDLEVLRLRTVLARMAPAARKALHPFWIRCAVQGCLLATVYRFPIGRPHNGGFRWYYEGRSKISLLNWAYADDRLGELVWHEVNCRHGKWRIDRSWLMECAVATTDAPGSDTVPGAAEALGRGTSRVFNPPAGSKRS